MQLTHCRFDGIDMPARVLGSTLIVCEVPVSLATTFSYALSVSNNGVEFSNSVAFALTATTQVSAVSPRVAGSAEAMQGTLGYNMLLNDDIASALNVESLSSLAERAFATPARPSFWLVK